MISYLKIFLFALPFFYSSADKSSLERRLGNFANKKLYISYCLPTILSKKKSNKIKKQSHYNYSDTMYMDIWRATSLRLKNENIEITNVCDGIKWSTYYTKINYTLNYMHRIVKNTINTDSLNQTYFLFSDIDAFWSVESMDKIISKFDSIRGNKKIVLSTEMNCWVERYCTDEHVGWYQKRGSILSHSSFINSGGAMGKILDIIKLYEFIRDDSEYLATASSFKDQRQFAFYGTIKAKNEVELDYNQELFGSFPIITAPCLKSNCSIEEDFKKKEHFVCKNRNGDVVKNCKNRLNYIETQLVNYFVVNNESCLLIRNPPKTANESPFYLELANLSPSPVLWHGNGASGKHLYEKYGLKLLTCLRNKYNI